MGRALAVIFVIILGNLCTFVHNSNTSVSAIATNFVVNALYVGNSWYIEFTKLSVTITGQMTDGTKGHIIPKGVHPPLFSKLPNISYKAVTSIRIAGEIAVSVQRTFGKPQKGTAKLDYVIPFINGKSYGQQIILGTAIGQVDVNSI